MVCCVCLTQPKGIAVTNWTVLDVSIEIRAAPSKANRILADKATRTRVVVSGAVIRWDVALTQGSPRAPCGYEKMPGRFAGIYLLLNLHHLECMLRLFNRYRTYRVACAQLFSPDLPTSPGAGFLTPLQEHSYVDPANPDGALCETL